MSNENSGYRIVFPPWYDERGEWEAEMKGFLQGIEIHVDNGGSHTLFFYDPVRLSQELEMGKNQGTPFIAEPNMVVIPEITRKMILEVVPLLIRDRYFERESAASSADSPSST